MAKYPLGPLLSSRIFREDAAVREARKAKAALEDAKDAAAAAREELRRYHEWRPGEEARLFERIRRKNIPASGLDQHREEVDALRMAELQREEAVAAADKAVVAAEKAEEKARQRQLAAARDRQKIEEHKNRWQIDEQRRQEAAEEAELEDFTSHSPLEEEEDIGPE